VFQRRLHSWLVALADPEGKAPVPSAALYPDRFVRLWSLAEHHGVLPAVIANARRLADAKGAGSIVRPSKDGRSSSELFSAGLARARRQAFRQSAATLAMRHQLAELAEAFGRRGVPVVVIKGVDFAERLYPSYALRSFGDIDLLVPERSLEEAEAVLKKLGYAPASGDMKYGAGYGETGFRRDDRASATVEVHWNLVNSPTVRRGVSVRYEDLQLLCSAGQADDPPKPSPASLLLIAGVHAAAGHAFDRLQLLCDICQAARQRAGRIDFDWLGKAVRQTGSGLALSLGLALAGRAFNEPECLRACRLLELPRALTARFLVTPEVVLRCHQYADSWRRQAFRELLKGSR